MDQKVIENNIKDIVTFLTMKCEFGLLMNLKTAFESYQKTGKIHRTSRDHLIQTKNLLEQNGKIDLAALVNQASIEIPITYFS